jgi:glycosyltransferase involved in cell wall biosynthesis
MVWCDVFALIGANEPFGVVFSEAMMAGKPIIYASDGGISDLAVSGIHGLSVAPNDMESATAALDDLLGNPGAREQFGRSAAALAEDRLTWAQNAAQLVDTFKAMSSASVENPGAGRQS